MKEALIRETIHVKREEEFNDLVAVGVMDIQAAKFLATHPTIYRKWKEDGEYILRLENQ